MRCFPWIQSVVQALTNGNKNGQEKNEDTLRQDVYQSSIGYAKSLEMTVSQLWTTGPRLRLNFKDQTEPLETVMEVRDDEKPNRYSLQPLTGPQDMATAFRSVPTNDYPIGKSNKPSTPKRISTAKEGLHDASLALDYNPAVEDYILSGRTQKPKTLKRRGKSSSLTIFLNSPLAPVMIIVTTPDDDSASEPGIPTGNTFNDIRARRIGTAPPPAPAPASPTPSTPRHVERMSTDSLFAPDISRLMPPTERQIDTRRLRKAREFREVRKFLINFLNTKGDQFPKKLRYRMMDLYSIHEADLDPAMVKKFALLDGEGRDEGVALEQNSFGYQDGTDADDLRILEMAFRSQIPVVRPRELVPHGRRGSREMIVQPPPSLGIGALKRRMTGGRRPEIVRQNEALVWPGSSSMSGSTSSLPTWGEIPGDEPVSPTKAQFTGSKREMYRLRKTTSEPNMQRPSIGAPPLPDYPHTSPVPSVERNNSLPSGAEVEHIARRMSVIDQSRLGPRKPNIVTSAFGTLLGAIGWSMNRAEKLREKEKLRA